MGIQYAGEQALTVPVHRGLAIARRKFFFVVNRKSGNYSKWLVQIRLGEFLTTEGVTGEVHYLRDTEALRARLDAAYDEGVRQFVVVGGDGTVSLVASQLRGKDCRIGIVPVGTSNMLAQLLGIPLGARRSLELLLGPHRVRNIDALDIAGRLFFLNASAGLSSFSISDLRTEEKTYLKLLAYVATVVRSMRKAKTRRFHLTIDGCPQEVDAAELFVDNAGALWMPRLRTSDAQLDDGRAEICYVNKGTPPELGNAVLDVLLVRKKRLSIRFIASAKTITVDCAEQIPVQADGDAIGSTPVDIRVVPAAASFIVPEPR
jgi:diacylglycerol kinase family enzyme